MKVFAIALCALAALAQQAPPLNPEILKWQGEAQARERAVNRRADSQISRAPRPLSPTRHRAPTVRRKLPKSRPSA